MKDDQIMMSNEPTRTSNPMYYKYLHTRAMCLVLFTLIGTQASAGTLAPGDGVQVVHAASSLGLDADTLACLDVHGSEPAIMLDRLNEEYATFEQYESLQGQLLEQQQIAYQARAVLRDFANDAEAATALSQAESEILYLRTQVRLTRMSLINTVLEGLADTSLVSDVLDGDGLLFSLPPQYRLAVNSENSAKEIAWALQKQDQADGSNTDLNPDAQQFLQQANTQSDVQLGTVRVQTFGQANETAMEQWMLSH